MKKKYIFIAAVTAIFYGCGNGSHNTSSQADNTNTTMSDSAKTGQTARASNDSTFLAFANNVGNFEIQAAQLAQSKSANKSVKDFAAMMINDHTEMGKKVSAMAGQKGITLPTTLPADLQSEYSKLDSLRGKKFDEEYIDANVKGHTEAISKFESVANSNDYSADVKQLASTALPTLNGHKQHAEEVQQTIKGNKKAS